MDKSIAIAILGNCTTDYIARALAEACKAYELEPRIYTSPYDQYRQDIINQDSGFYAAKPQLSILFLEGYALFPEWFEFSLLTAGKEEKLARLQAVFEDLITLIEKIHANSDSKILLHNFQLPYYASLGILDSKYYPGSKDMVALLNTKLNEWAADKDYVYIFDYNGLKAQFGYQHASSQKLIYLANNPITLAFTQNLAREYLRYLLPIKGLNKKCLVLDLDNTLWGGVAGEDGLAGIKLDRTGVGKSFFDFQREILNLYQKGIILAINSKNNFEDALQVIENHPHMLLRRTHFSSLKINWEDKAQNLLAIAKELNIGLDSLVFFDDNPVERELVKAMLPMVTVVAVPNDSSKYADTLKELLEFEQLKLTQEDLDRNAMYQANQKRNKLISRYKTLDEYLESLEIKMILEQANEFTIPRLAQLTQKTNQFNMTTKRYTQADMEIMAHSESFLVLSCQALDRFGDNGITGLCIAKKEGDEAFIDTYLLSCRILGRNIEYALIQHVVSRLFEEGIRKVSASFIQTEKNKANEDFYEKAGFSKQASKGLYYVENKKQLKSIPYIEIITK